MRNAKVWSVGLGRWWNVHVRLHMMFFIFAAFVLFLASQFSGASNWFAPLILLTFLVSVLLHEISHVIVARRLGGYAEEIVLTPLGGHNSVRVPYEPHSEIVALMAGILANVTICFLCAVTLGLTAPEVQFADLLRPTVSFLRPEDPGVLAITRTSVLQTVFWVNWSLILINLIPAYPFDGGYALQALMTFFWPELEPKHTHGVICRLGKVFAAVAIIGAWFTYERYELGPQPPIWFALVMLSIYLYFSSRLEEVQQQEVEQHDDTVFGYDFSQGYTSLERSAQADEASRTVPEPSLLGKWLERRREAQRERELEQAAEDERRVDDVLQRLHDHGMPSLSKDDRALLNRVSQRYRSREST